MLKLFLVRHGETDMNVERRYQGSLNTPLNNNGRSQAKKLAPILAQHKFDAIYSSDLQRVLDTAIHAGIPKEPIIHEPRMRELDFGKFEGMTHSEIAQKYPAELLAWGEDREDNVHGGEKTSEVVARVTDFYDHLMKTYVSRETVLCFAHGGTIAIFLAVAMGLDPHKWWQFLIENTAVTEVNLYDSGTLLKKFNDTHHLD